MNGEGPPVVFETLTARALGESRTRVADGHLANFLPGYRRDAIGRDAVIDHRVMTSRPKIVDDGRFVENLRHLVRWEAVAIRMGIAKARSWNEGVPTCSDPKVEAESD